VPFQTQIFERIFEGIMHDGAHFLMEFHKTDVGGI
jgi:hypothetical protein